jgi:hypothetical protein
MPDGDSSPCIDGLKIFPEAQERRREDGFTEFIVSAYGRANAIGNYFKSKKVGAVTKSAQVFATHNLYDGGLNVTLASYDNIVSPEEGGGINILGDVVTFKIALPANQIPSLSAPANLIRRYNSANGEDITEKTYVLSDLYNSGSKGEGVTGPPSGNTLIPAYYTPAGNGSFTPKAITWTESLISIESVNYGSFDEFTLVWEDAGGRILFGTFNQNQKPEHAHIEVQGIDGTSYNLIVGQQPHQATNRITKLELWVYNNNVLTNGYNGKEYTAFQQFPSGDPNATITGVQETLSASSGDTLKIIVKLTNPFGESTREFETIFAAP